MPHLGVNIDHVATIRQARGGVEPDPVWAAAEAELGGAACITIHLREDRRHIQDRDLDILRRTVQVKLNLEMAVTDAMLEVACRALPQQATLVPEGRQELTTEGGLAVAAHEAKVTDAVKRLQDAGIVVSHFIDPSAEEIEAAARTGAEAVEFHTGEYANAPEGVERDRQLARIVEGAKQARTLGLTVHAGHGLNYTNVRPVASIAGMEELNIGHSIISRAVFVGLREAVREMVRLIESPLA
ncbi:MAG TPA: pyridoxine 5'-phosphate synthase [Phycisphaerae bacterium]|nr:pyridoxine 5'-phosphate synthase [Phycisphaerae bacterium]